MSYNGEHRELPPVAYHTYREGCGVSYGLWLCS